MKKAFAVTLILMAILTVIYVSAAVYANNNSSSTDDFYDYDLISAAFEYESETPPTDWHTPEELGIYDVLELFGEDDSSWLHIAVVSKEELESAIFLYKDKFYQVSRYPWLNRYVGYAASKYEGDAPPSVWYTPEELGIYYVEECGENVGWIRISVDQAKEPFPFPFDAPDDDLIIFLYKDEFYTVSRRSISFDCEGAAMPWQIPIGAALGTGWIFTGVLFLRRKKE